MNDNNTTVVYPLRRAECLNDVSDRDDKKLRIETKKNTNVKKSNVIFHVTPQGYLTPATK